MSYENFKPTIWSKYIQTELPKFTLLKQDCDYKFEGEVGQGKRVKILGIARPTIKTYAKTDIDEAEDVNDTSIYLDIDQWKYFNYGIDDIDKAQSVDGIMETLMEETNRAIAEDQDTFIANLVKTGAGAYSSTTSVSSKATAKAAIDLGLVTLWDNGVSQRDKVTMYLSPKVYQYMNEYIVEAKTQNDALMANGILGMYSGANVKMTNNLYNDGTDDYIIIKTSKAIAFASGIDELIPYSPEKRFKKNAIKCLTTYGGKIVRPKELYVLKAH